MKAVTDGGRAVSLVRALTWATFATVLALLRVVLGATSDPGRHPVMDVVDDIFGQCAGALIVILVAVTLACLVSALVEGESAGRG